MNRGPVSVDNLRTRGVSADLARRIVELLDDLDTMTARAGGWAHRIPTEQRAAWEQRKRRLLADVGAHRAGSEAPDLVGVAEAARICGVSRAAIYKHVERGTIPPPTPVAGTDAHVWPREVIRRWAATRPRPGGHA